MYRVKSWEEHFESAKSKTYKHKSQTYMPNKHGLGYKMLLKRKNGPALFGAWCAMIQVLSRQHPRQGYLTDTGRPDGMPYTADMISAMTEIPASIYSELLQHASMQDVGWLDVIEDKEPQGYHKDTTGILQSPYPSPLPLPLPSPLPACADVEVPKRFQVPEFFEAFSRFEEHRKKLNKPLSNGAKMLSLKKLDKLPDLPTAIRWLDNAVEKGWQGLYDPDGKIQQSPGINPRTGKAYNYVN